MNIGYFLHNGEKIIISKKDDKYAFKKESNTEFTQEEKELLKNVNNLLTIKRESSRFIKKIRLSKTYDLYYDTKSRNYYWIPEDNIYDEKDNRILNFQYNHQEEILEFENYPNIEDSKFYKKILNFGKKSLVLFLASSIALSMNFPTKKNDEVIETTPEQTISYEETILNETTPSTENIIIEETIPEESVVEETVPEETQVDEIIYIYDFKDVEEAIDRNPNLTEEEKNIIKSTKFIYDENYMYMDMELVLSRLETLKIIYDYNFENRYTQGTYSITDNVIKLRNKTIRGALQEFIHEYLHMLQISHNSFLMELSNQFFTNEVIMRLHNDRLIEDYYFYDNLENKRIINGKDYTQYSDSEKYNLLCRDSVFERGYMGYAGIYYVLAELLPEEVLRAYQFDPGNLEILVTGLEQIEPNKDFYKAINLLVSIGEIRKYNYETLNWEYASDIGTQFVLLNDFYKSVKGENIIDNPELLFFFMIDDTSIIDKEELVGEEYKILNEFARTYNDKFKIMILPKTYLSDIRSNSVIVYKEEQLINSPVSFVPIDENFESDYEYFRNNYQTSEEMTR
ncbi:MAG: hypothetical protein IJ399_00945 [Bacilli bacterium]|nr:hypothetical protein [Bacilli bacterium]